MCRLAGHGREGREGRTGRSRVAATHIESRFHAGVEGRLYPKGCADSTELQQKIRFWIVFLGLPHPLQAGPPFDFHVFKDIFPYLLGKGPGDTDGLCNTGVVQYFPEFRCSFGEICRRTRDP